ncbi:MAG: cation:proton antiporter, partial [Thioalkalispiraceae bacterium]
MQLHTDVIAPVILGTTGILFFAVVGRFTARYFNQPSVLGELLVGILIGVLGYTFSIDFIEILREGPIVFDIVGEVLSGDSLEHAATTMVNGDYSRHLLEILSGPHGQDYFKVAQAVDIFSRYGVIFMLFLIGLETSLADMRKVGRDSTLVATIGVVVPFALGVVLTLVLLPEIDLQVDLFIAATLVATSVGITARVLKDINRMQTRSARVILGAAVID